PTDVIACPTRRDPDGMAMSSRNMYLSPEERQKGLSISRALMMGYKEFKDGVRQTNRLITTMQKVMLEQHVNIDYVAAVDPETLKPVEKIEADPPGHRRPRRRHPSDRQHRRHPAPSVGPARRRRPGLSLLSH